MKKLAILIGTVSLMAGLLPAYAGLSDLVGRIPAAERAESNESGAPDLERLTCDEQVAALQEYIETLECRARCSRVTAGRSRFQALVALGSCLRECD